MNDRSKEGNVEKDPGSFIATIHERDPNRAFLDRVIDYRSMLCDGGRATESLGGWWSFAPDPYDTCIRSRWYEEVTHDAEGRALPLDYSFDSWEEVRVPSCWNRHAERYALYEGSAVYTRRFSYVNRGERHVLLKFGAVNYDAKVFLNGRYLGMHRGGFTPFYVDATTALAAENRLLVVVNNSRERDAVPCDNTDWFNYGGIHRDVELIRLPAAFIRRFGLSALPGSGLRELRVEVEVEMGRDLPRAPQALLEIAELGVRASIALHDGRGSVTVAASPQPWSPQTPTLYDVSLSFAGDRVRERIGFREIAVEGDQILLNGTPLFLKGICTHEESVEGGRTLSDAEIEENLRLARELGCNFVRLAHYPHSERVARFADELGVLLWEEIPVYWAIDFENPETYANAENQLRELIERDRNRASVIVWSVGNENADTDSRYQFMSALARTAKATDPTRLVSAACLIDRSALRIADRLADVIDVIGINEYYGWYEPDFSKLAAVFANSRPLRPVLITETGADAKAGFHGTADDLGTEECQRSIYRAQLEMISRVPWIRGIAPWILYDFRSPRRLNALQRQYNIKGLLSADKRHRKLAFYELQRFYREG